MTPAALQSPGERTLRVPEDAPVIPQHMAALQRANELRVVRADLQRAIAAGDVQVGDILAVQHSEPLPCVQTMPVLRLLIAQSRWGESRGLKAMRVIGAVGDVAHKPVGSLTARQCDALIAYLDGSGSERREGLPNA